MKLHFSQRHTYVIVGALIFAVMWPLSVFVAALFDPFVDINIPFILLLVAGGVLTGADSGAVWHECLPSNQKARKRCLDQAKLIARFPIFVLLKYVADVYLFHDKKSFASGFFVMIPFVVAILGFLLRGWHIQQEAE